MNHNKDSSGIKHRSDVSSSSSASGSLMHANTKESSGETISITTTNASPTDNSNITTNTTTTSPKASSDSTLTPSAAASISNPKNSSRIQQHEAIKSQNDALQKKLKRMSLQEEFSEMSHQRHSDDQHHPHSDEFVHWVHRDIRHQHHHQRRRRGNTSQQNPHHEEGGLNPSQQDHQDTASSPTNITATLREKLERKQRMQQMLLSQHKKQSSRNSLLARKSSVKSPGAADNSQIGGENELLDQNCDSESDDGVTSNNNANTKRQRFLQAMGSAFSSEYQLESPKRVGFQVMKKYEERQIREEKFSKKKKKTEYASNITHKLVSPYQVKLQWHEAPKHVFLVPNNYSSDVRDYFKKVVEYLYVERQCMVIVEPETLEVYPEFSFLLSWSNPKEKAYILKTVDVAICMGGDGTVLHCVRQFRQSCPPVLGFGMGSIGFLTLFDVKKYKSIISKVLAKSIHISTRARLTCMIERYDGTTETHDSYQVMNELVVDRGPSPYLTSLDTFCNGKLITNVQADGLIVATPNGSSAYNMSAGGSIVHPSVVCMLLTPICPHSLSFRPIILPDSVKLKIQVPNTARNSAYLSFDGSHRQELRKGDSVHIETSEWPVPLIVTSDATSAWFRDLSESFGWSVRKQQRPFEQ